MFASSQNFKPSVNVKYDIGDQEFVNRYLPTPSHAESLIGLADAFANEKGNNSHIMIGPYGSGKSLIATIVADFVSKAIAIEDINLLVDKFEKVHQDVHTSLKGIVDLKRKYIPITLSGDEGSFGEAIVTSVVRKMREEGIEIVLSGEATEIENIVNQWTVKFPETFNAFLRLLNDKNQDLSEWLIQMKTDGFKEIEWFKSVYPSLSAGAEFNIKINDNFSEQIEVIKKKLIKENLGIFIIYDEFGRLLQSLSGAMINKTMQDIQDLAEIASRSDNLLHLLLISHKNMSQYMLGFNEEHRSEFQRVEKRFETYFVESDTGTYYRITEQYTSKLIRKYPLQLPDINSVIKELRKYDLFEELNNQEVEKIIVESSYPIHPITLFLLPRISKIFGQNERTLFTFLESSGTGGLENHIGKDQGYYYAYHLFDYFFANNYESHTNNEDFNSLKIYRKITSNLTKETEYDIYEKVLKLITLWELSHSNSIYKINSSIIAFATGESIDVVDNVLEKMVELKVIRFNRVLNQWELHEGSSLVVTELIDEEKINIKITQQKRISFVEQILPKKYFLAPEYNDEKNITRFVQIKVVSSNEILNEENSGELFLPSEKSDGLVCFIVLEDKRDYTRLKEKVTSIKSNLLFFCILKDEFKTIRSFIDEEMALFNLLNDKELLSENAFLEEELLILHEETLHIITIYLDKYYKFDNQVTWINNGVILTPRNEIEFENILTKKMFEEYPLTPVIMNDSINRRKVNSVQRRALYRVLDGVIKESSVQNLGIEGQGPDYLVYATVFKNNGFDINLLDDISNIHLTELRQRLFVQLQKIKKGSLFDLSRILEESPFGIRRPLVPLLFVSLLRDKWDQLMFYRNKMFVPALEAEKVYEMFDEPHNYQYEFHDYSVGIINLMEDIEGFVYPHISEYVLDKTPLIKVSSGLLNWLRHLSRYTQITQQLPKSLIDLKEVIRKSEINPLESIEILEEIYGNNVEYLKADMEKLEVAYRDFVKTVESYLLDKIGYDKFSDRKKYIELHDVKTIVNNQFLLSLSDVNDIEEFAMKYIGIELWNWSDTTFGLFQTQVINDIQKLDNRVASGDDVIELAYNDKYKHIKVVELSTKSQIIYNNVNRMIKSAGRSVPREEIDYIIYKLIDEYIE